MNVSSVIVCHKYTCLTQIQHNRSNNIECIYEVPSDIIAVYRSKTTCNFSSIL
jgi:hypothetical protein